MIIPRMGLFFAHREVTDHVQDVASPHSIARHHGNHWLGQAANLDLWAHRNVCVCVCVCVRVRTE